MSAGKGAAMAEQGWGDDDLLFVPLGGAGEIGMNANLFHYGGRWLMVDLGISFPDETMPGVDVLLPDLGFIEERRDALDGLVVTHGHEDHLGAIPYLWERLRCPVYGTPFTLALVRGKIREHLPDADIQLVSLPFNSPVDIGPFGVEFISLTHSIPDPAGLVLRAGGKTIFHTGDWRFDHDPAMGPVSDIDALRALGDSGVDAMIGDSTNAMVEGRAGSEGDAGRALAEAIAAEKGRVAVTCFASNVARLDSIVRAAAETGRSPVLVGRALHRVVEAARSCGYLKDWPDMPGEGEVNLLPPESVLLVCTGSQGEPRSALARIAAGTHHKVALEAGDTVMFSSREIPGNEVAIGKVQDNLVRRGVKVITERDAPIHVSGHPGREEMAEMYQLIRPAIAVPVHGTPRHLRAHAELARDCQVEQVVIPENGSVIRLNGDGAASIGSADTGLMTVEAGELLPADGDTMRDRRRMLWNGNVSVSVVLSRAGELCAAPEVRQSGLTEGHRGDDFLAEASLRVEDALAALDHDALFDDARLEKAVGGCVKALARSMFERRPLLQVHILRVDAPAAG